MSGRYRHAIALLSLLIALAALTGARSPAAVRAHGHDVTTIVWYNNADPSRNVWERHMIAAFEATHPTIHVQLEIVSATEFDPKLNALWAAGRPPDIWSQWGGNGFRDFYNRHMIIDQTPYIRADAKALHLEDIPKQLINLYTVGGKIYGIPIFSIGSYVFYNVDLFRAAHLPEPPASWSDRSWTWAAMVNMAKKLTHDYGNPVKGQYGLNAGLYGIDAFPWLFGASVFDANAFATGVPRTNHLTAPGSIAAYQALADITYRYKVQPSPALLQGFASMGNPMFSGRLAMQLTGGWDFWILKPSKIHWSVAPLPWTYKERRDVDYSDPMFICSKSKNPQAAWEFVKSLNTLAGAKTMIADLLVPSPHQSLLPLWYREFPTVPLARLKAVYPDSIRYGSESTNHLLVNYAQIFNTVTQDTQPILLGQKTAAQQLPVAQAHLNTVLQANQ